MVDTAPENSDSINVSVSFNIPFGITFSWEIDTDGLNVSNNSDIFDGTVDINQSYNLVGTNHDIVKETSIGFTTYVDTEGPNHLDGYNATEKHTIGYKTNGFAIMTGKHVLEYDVHIVAEPMDEDDAVTKLD